MNYEQMSNNKLYLSGEIVSDPVFSHEIYGEGFYEMSLSVPRLSDYKDVLPLTISERLITDNNIKKGSVIAVMGQFRSYNKIEDGKSRLMLTVFAREVTEAENKNPNLIALSGIYASLPFTERHLFQGKSPTYCLRLTGRITSPIISPASHGQERKIYQASEGRGKNRDKRQNTKPPVPEKNRRGQIRAPHRVRGFHKQNSQRRYSERG